MRTFAILSLLAGLVAAASDPLDEQFFPVTGYRCCADATEDIGGHCKAAGFSAYCCTRFDSRKGSGCDDTLGFKIGRVVQQVRLDSMSACASENRKGFIGCV
ncbi:hypothetical protein MGG_15924 [Pyricularia oryzae 70-15]|uniref:Extracellular membrane protein CFEM domain-containing protein n=3 Tax=Pyricularia oryzae TaxID=318829 RepID=G4MVY9_PYRO7|nr:uncharacterized protein MGG_15924 [Pyricularia oryzae 70-15]EHA55857.1 hypothetical protein MGG_15924 [Pyricularia oryzae 70-15]ELQ43724.1 hypothetical protein OOU_Y34scaffold00138g3 [Pyricularia oryzae Y34]KAI7909625.1 hypothetical protein M9X92_011524 [Pyricularia oryzae]KAI7909991.1 hypothetical protein M0657_011583 [Pyricularia oryzae]